jgi:hypothetical protein
MGLWAAGCLLLAAASVAAGDAAATDSTVAAPKSTPGAVPFAPGEFLLFSIDYGPVNAGEASLEVRDIILSDGRPCYRVESKARSNRFFSAFYMVRDKVVSHIDTETLFSRYFSKRLREGDYRKNVAIRFDHEAGKARYADQRELDIPSGVHDILSAFYFVRTMDLVPGTSAFIHTHSSHQNYDLEVIVHGREIIQVPAGTFDCYRVEPIILGEGLFQFDGQLTIWLTADERRLPVLMKTKVKVGAIDAALKSFTLGEPLREARR